MRDLRDALHLQERGARPAGVRLDDGGLHGVDDVLRRDDGLGAGAAAPPAVEDLRQFLGRVRRAERLDLLQLLVDAPVRGARRRHESHPAMSSTATSAASPRTAASTYA